MICVGDGDQETQPHSAIDRARASTRLHHRSNFAGGKIVSVGRVSRAYRPVLEHRKTKRKQKDREVIKSAHSQSVLTLTQQLSEGGKIVVAPGDFVFVISNAADTTFVKTAWMPNITTGFSACYEVMSQTVDNLRQAFQLSKKAFNNWLVAYELPEDLLKRAVSYFEVRSLSEAVVRTAEYLQVQPTEEEYEEIRSRVPPAFRCKDYVRMQLLRSQVLLHQLHDLSDLVARCELPFPPTQPPQCEKTEGAARQEILVSQNLIERGKCRVEVLNLIAGQEIAARWDADKDSEEEDALTAEDKEIEDS